METATNLVNLQKYRKQKRTDTNQAIAENDKVLERKVQRLEQELEYRTDKLAGRVLELEDEMAELRKKLNSVILFLTRAE